MPLVRLPQSAIAKLVWFVCANPDCPVPALKRAQPSRRSVGRLTVEVESTTEKVVDSANAAEDPAPRVGHEPTPRVAYCVQCGSRNEEDRSTPGGRWKPMETEPEPELTNGEIKTLRNRLSLRLANEEKARRRREQQTKSPTPKRRRRLARRRSAL